MTHGFWDVIAYGYPVRITSKLAIDGWESDCYEVVTPHGLQKFLVEEWEVTVCFRRKIKTTVQSTVIPKEIESDAA